jgi:hypothetical protein
VFTHKLIHIILYCAFCWLLYCIVGYCIVLLVIVLLVIVLYCWLLYCIVGYCIVGYCIVGYCIVLLVILSLVIVLLVIVLLVIVLYCWLLYCKKQQCTVEHSSLLRRHLCPSLCSSGRFVGLQYLHLQAQDTENEGAVTFETSGIPHPTHRHTSVTLYLQQHRYEITSDLVI